MTTVVRAVRPEDADTMYALGCEAAGVRLDRQVFDVMFKSCLSSSQHRAVLVMMDELPAGWGELEISYSMMSPGLTATLAELYIRPAYRSRGAGRAALIHLAETARRMGCRQMLATCSRVNLRSLDFLEQNGFCMGRVQFEHPLSAPDRSE